MISCSMAMRCWRRWQTAWQNSSLPCNGIQYLVSSLWKEAVTNGFFIFPFCNSLLLSFHYRKASNTMMPQRWLWPENPTRQTGEQTRRTSIPYHVLHPRSDFHLRLFRYRINKTRAEAFFIPAGCHRRRCGAVRYLGFCGIRLRRRQRRLLRTGFLSGILCRG